jgi:hypothetical protein
MSWAKAVVSPGSMPSSVTSPAAQRKGMDGDSKSYNDPTT